LTAFKSTREHPKLNYREATRPAETFESVPLGFIAANIRPTPRRRSSSAKSPNEQMEQDVNRS